VSLTVWGRLSSVNVQKVVWCAEELGIEYRRVEAGGKFGVVDTPGYLAMNPNGLVPVIDDDGFVLYESNAIVRYLATKAGATALWPEDPRGRADVDRWMEWQSTGYTPAMGPAFMQLVRTAPEKRDVGTIEASRVKSEKHAASSTRTSPIAATSRASASPSPTSSSVAPPTAGCTCPCSEPPAEPRTLVRRNRRAPGLAAGHLAGADHVALRSMSRRPPPRPGHRGSRNREGTRYLVISLGSLARRRPCSERGNPSRGGSRLDKDLSVPWMRSRDGRYSPCQAIVEA
jgi:hypothetical protein